MRQELTSISVEKTLSGAGQHQAFQSLSKAEMAKLQLSAEVDFLSILGGWLATADPPPG
jgi:hypothetical protein